MVESIITVLGFNAAPAWLTGLCVVLAIAAVAVAWKMVRK